MGEQGYSGIDVNNTNWLEVEPPLRRFAHFVFCPRPAHNGALRQLGSEMGVVPVEVFFSVSGVKNEQKYSETRIITLANQAMGVKKDGRVALSFR